MGKSFSECVGELFFGWYVDNVQQPFCNLVTNEIKVNFDVLHLRMVDMIGSNKSSSKIVTTENKFMNFDTKFK